MSQISKLYEAYCKEQDNAPITPEKLHLYEVLSSILTHEEYLKMESLINASYDESDKEFFFAGFRAATRLWAEAIK